MDLTLDIAGAGWQPLTDPEATVCAAAKAALSAADVAADDIEVSVVLADDDFVADLNQRWRGKTGPTNVLSFPVDIEMALGDGEPRFIGDIALASGVVARQAGDTGKPLASHLSHLVVHGILHLLGYDHEDDLAAERMQVTEIAAMKLLGLPDPYLEYEETATAL